MPIFLETGTPGAGKTLYLLSQLIPSLMGDLQREGRPPLKRRLCVGNVRDLTLDHELIDVPRIRDWDAYLKADPVWRDWGAVERLPGTPPIEGVPRRADTWHLWCEPGDLIVIDEAQHTFKPMAAGRALPGFLTNLEEHRHYGVDFILLTQQPNLLHANVRALVNPHVHLRRLWGRAAAMVYEFDACSNPKAVSQAQSKKVWRHDKRAYELYRSSELHTKFSRALPLPLVLAAVAIIATPIAWWYAFHRSLGGSGSAVPVAAVAASAVPGHAAPAWAAQGEGRMVPTSYVAPVGKPAYQGAIKPRDTWPEQVAGCWQQGEEPCKCITQEEPPRVIVDRPMMCHAILVGDLVPPKSHPSVRRYEPEPVAPSQAVPASSSAPMPSVLPQS